MESTQVEITVRRRVVLDELRSVRRATVTESYEHRLVARLMSASWPPGWSAQHERLFEDINDELDRANDPETTLAFIAHINRIDAAASASDSAWAETLREIHRRVAGHGDSERVAAIQALLRRAT